MGYIISRYERKERVEKRMTPTLTTHRDGKWMEKKRGSRDEG